EAPAIPPLQEDPAAEVAVDPPQVPGIDRQPVLVELARARDDTQAQQRHTCSRPIATDCPARGGVAGDRGPVAGRLRVIPRMVSRCLTGGVERYTRTPHFRRVTPCTAT